MAIRDINRQYDKLGHVISFCF